MGSLSNIPRKVKIINGAIFTASIFYFFMLERPSSRWIGSEVIQKYKNPEINYTSPIIINWINEANIHSKINQIQERSSTHTKIEIPSRAPLLVIMSNIAYLINFLDCNNSNNVGSKVPGLQIKVHAEFYSYSLDYSALVIMFAGPKLTKKQWASRNSNQVQFRFEGYPGFDPEARVETQLLEDVEMLFPILKETIYDFLSRFPKATKTYEIAFVGHALGGAYAYIAGFRWALERKIIEIGKFWPDINLTGIAQEIFTFGAPRVGNRQLSSLLNNAIKIFRFTHGNDHVPHFPSASTGWKHSGVEIWIEPLGDCDCSDERNVYWDCNNSLLSQTQRNLWVNGIYSEENMMCNAGQSINEVSESFFHNGPYFNIEMGNCGPSMTNN